MSETLDLEKLAAWSAPKQISTARGQRILRTAPVTEQFWAIWRSNKPALKEAGIGPSQRNGAWEICWWRAVDPAQEAREQARAAEALETSRATDAEVELPKPDGLEYLGYQKAGIRYAMGCYSTGIQGCLIGDEMGLGKTIQAIGLINATSDIQKVVIVCPNTLKGNWARELRKWLTRPLKIGVQQAGSRFLGDAVDVLILNFDSVHKFSEQLGAIAWDLRIVDEAHYCKNAKARRTKATFGIAAKRKLSLTGTPILNRPVELFPILSDLHPGRWPAKSFFSFAKRYCGAHNNGYGWDFGGASNLDELQNILRSTVMVRRLKADVLTELPPKRRQVLELPADKHEDLLARERSAFDPHAKQLEDLQLRVELAKTSDNPADYQAAVEAMREGMSAAFAEMAKVRHAIALAKVPMITELISDALENGKVVLFAHHLDVVAAYKEQFPTAAVVTGEVKVEDRMKEVDRFQKDPSCTLFIGNDAAAEGLTLTASAHVIFAEGDWVPGKLAQKEDRTHRIGQTNAVLVTHAVMEGSLDAYMLKRIVEKQDVIDQALDRKTERSLVEPIAPAPAEPVTRLTVTYEQVQSIGPTLTPEQIAKAHEGLKILAGMCDGAAKLDSVGFNKFDARMGHELAGRSYLTAKQAVLAAKLCRKYRRQLGEEFGGILVD